MSVLVSVRLSVPLIDSSSGGWRAAGGFAAERPVIDSFGRAAGVVLQAPALSSKCGYRHVDSRRRRLITNSCNFVLVPNTTRHRHTDYIQCYEYTCIL